jgi:pyrroline-5-carboxylate reductase
VTSKGGTTERAINFLKEKNVDKLIEKALYLAKKRADELGKNYLK